MWDKDDAGEYTNQNNAWSKMDAIYDGIAHSEIDYLFADGTDSVIATAGAGF